MSAGAPFEDAINGLRSMDGTKGSWELPLQPHNGGIEPDWTWAGDEQAARREAAERISANYESIVRFAARGAGSKGMPRYGAALSDPNAIPNDAVQTTVDQVLRTVCLALLEGTDKFDVTMSEMATVIAKQGGKEYAGGVVASLAYLRDRVGGKNNQIRSRKLLDMSSCSSPFLLRSPTGYETTGRTATTSAFELGHWKDFRCHKVKSISLIRYIGHSQMKNKKISMNKYARPTKHITI